MRLKLETKDLWDPQTGGGQTRVPRPLSSRGVYKGKLLRGCIDTEEFPDPGEGDPRLEVWGRVPTSMGVDPHRPRGPLLGKTVKVPKYYRARAHGAKLVFGLV